MGPRGVFHHLLYTTSAAYAASAAHYDLGAYADGAVCAAPKQQRMPRRDR